MMATKLPARVDSEDLELLEEAARRYARASFSENTRRSYRADWADFQFWCKRKRRSALPATPDTLALYLTEMASHVKTSTLRRRVTAIRQAHELARHPTPTKDAKVRTVLRGIIRTKGEAQKHAAPTLLKHIQLMMKSMPDTPKGIRDKCLLLLGFAGGFRRSELVSLDIEDLALSEEGLVVTIRKSKTDQTGRGRTVAIVHGEKELTCPIRALNEWLKISGIKSGPLFVPINQWGQFSPTRLTDQSVLLVLKESLKRAGINSRGFSGHSLRAGFATVAAINGASEREIQRTTGHMSLEVLRRYIRDADIFRETASRKLGL